MDRYRTVQVPIIFLGEVDPMRSSLSHNKENLPEELRNWAVNRERKNLDPTLLREAADEIEQLRAEIDRLNETHEEERQSWDLERKDSSDRVSGSP